MKNIEWRVTLGIKTAIYDQDPETYKGMWVDLLQSCKFPTKEKALRLTDKLLDNHPKVSSEITTILRSYEGEDLNDLRDEIYYEGRDALKSAVKDTY
jgi:hypothetical protein